MASRRSWRRANSPMFGLREYLPSSRPRYHRTGFLSKLDKILQKGSLRKIFVHNSARRRLIKLRGLHFSCFAWFTTPPTFSSFFFFNWERAMLKGKERLGTPTEKLGGPSKKEEKYTTRLETGLRRENLLST